MMDRRLAAAAALCIQNTRSEIDLPPPPPRMTCHSVYFPELIHHCCWLARCSLFLSLPKVHAKILNYNQCHADQILG